MRERKGEIDKEVFYHIRDKAFYRLFHVTLATLMKINYKLYTCGHSSYKEDFSFTTFINEINESHGHSLTTFTTKRTLFI